MYDMYVSRENVGWMAREGLTGLKSGTGSTGGMKFPEESKGAFRSKVKSDGGLLICYRSSIIPATPRFPTLWESPRALLRRSTLQRGGLTSAAAVDGDRRTNDHVHYSFSQRFSL